MMTLNIKSIKSRTRKCIGAFHGGQNGFFLLESIIAAGIFTVMLLSVIGTTFHIIQSNRMSNNLTCAVNLAQNMLDDLIVTAYASIANSTETGIDENASPGGIFDRSVSITENTTLEYKTATVTVSWSDGRSRQVVLTAVIDK
jgi:Tfp pilus assembly protein PilV